MPDANGYQTRAEISAEWAAAEADLKAHRGPVELAGEPTAQEAKALAAAELRMTEAEAAFSKAVRAVIDAAGTPAEDAARRDQARAELLALDARGDWIRLSVNVSEACRVRRAAAGAVR